MLILRKILILQRFSSLMSICRIPDRTLLKGLSKAASEQVKRALLRKTSQILKFCNENVFLGREISHFLPVESRIEHYSRIKARNHLKLCWRNYEKIFKSLIFVLKMYSWGVKFPIFFPLSSASIFYVQFHMLLMIFIC